MRTTWEVPEMSITVTRDAVVEYVRFTGEAVDVNGEVVGRGFVQIPLAASNAIIELPEVSGGQEHPT